MLNYGKLPLSLVNSLLKTPHLQLHLQSTRQSTLLDQRLRVQHTLTVSMVELSVPQVERLT